MIKNRIIPLLLLKDGRMVKTIKFDKQGFRDVGNPSTAARVYDAQRADELIFLDISASQEDRKIFFDLVRQVAEECFMPLGVGGGIRSINDIREVLKIGADKVIINTAAVENPKFIMEAVQKFGSSTIVISIDAKKNENEQYEVMTHGGTKKTGLDVIELSKEVEKIGAGEIMITSIEREGTMRGLDLVLVEKIVESVKVPVIACGGVDSLEDFKRGFLRTAVSAISAGSIFHFTDQSPIMTRNYLFNQGISVRP
ncbi:imidazole glycerol phosphate synthase subunit HisF [Candidatus Peregrinibacteria bacterium]|nr:imidazole glycerol phosphate synthase subunit HisF [Candidatus Peregrinibacteria bacterium]